LDGNIANDYLIAKLINLPAADATHENLAI